MKKIVFILLSLVTVITNAYFFMTKNNSLAFDFLYPEDRQVISFELNEEISVLQLIYHLEVFSLYHDISIAQVNNFFDLNINIYMTNIENNPNIRLVQGTYPSGNIHLSNRRFDVNNASQSGQFVFPISNLDIRIYEIDQIRNIGLIGTFHLIGANDVVVNQFVDEFSRFGEVELAQDIHLDDYIQRMLEQSAESSLFSSAIIFSFFALLIGTCLFLLQYRRKPMLEHLWGYSSTYGFISIPKMFFLFYIVLSTGVMALLVAILWFNHAWNYLWIHLIRSLLINLSIAIIFWLFLVLGIILAKRFNTMAISLKGKKFFERILWVSFAVKTVTSIFLLVVIISFVSSLQEMQYELEQLVYWQQAEDIYRLQGGIVGDGGGLWGEFTEIDEDGNEIEFWRIVDFERLVAREEALRELFFLLETYKDAFFFEADAFFRIELEDDEWMYAYELDKIMREEWWLPMLQSNPANVDPIMLYLAEKGIYDIAGRRIMVTENYLRRNSIYGIDGRNVLEQLVNDTYTLNVLLPDHYRTLESYLKLYFLQDFYFERINLVNWYLEELDLPLLDITIDDLRINFIYTSLGQSYFSFNRLVGDEHALIWDPIVMIHHDDVGVANMAVRVKSNLYFVDDSRGHAFGSVQPFLNEVGVYVIQSVISMFDQGSETLVSLQWQIFSETLNLIMNSVFLLLLSIVLIWAYYSMNAYQINLKYLFGYSYLERNLELIIFIFSTNAIATILIIYASGLDFTLIGIALFLFLIDLIIISLLGNHLTKKNIHNVIKGSE